MWSFNFILAMIIYVVFVGMFLSDFLALIKTSKKIFVYDLLLDAGLIIGFIYLTNNAKFF